MACQRSSDITRKEGGAFDCDHSVGLSQPHIDTCTSLLVQQKSSRSGGTGSEGLNSTFQTSASAPVYPGGYRENRC